MTQRTIDKMRRRSGLDGSAYYLCVIPGAAITAFIAYGTFRHGLWAILSPDGGWMLLSLFSCIVALVKLWRSRTRREKPKEQIRLNLE